MAEQRYENLVELHKLLVDGRRGLESVAKRAVDQDVKELMLDMAERHATMEAELGEHMQERGAQDLADTGTLGGTLDRGAMTVRDVVNSTSDVNLLTECERQEEDLVWRCDHLLNQLHYPPETKAMLERVRGELEGSLQSLTRMRRSLETVER